MMQHGTIAWWPMVQPAPTTQREPRVVGTMQIAPSWTLVPSPSRLIVAPQDGSEPDPDIGRKAYVPDDVRAGSDPEPAGIGRLGALPSKL